MSYEPAQQKKKYHTKVASENGIYLTWLRLLDISPLFAEWMWLQIPLFDLLQLGLVIMFDIPPIEFIPYMLDFTYSLPSIEEVMQGIWMKFTPVDYALKYAWTTSVDSFIDANYAPPYNEQLKTVRIQKAYYDISPYDYSYYDPITVREFLRATFHKLRLMRTSDTSYLADMGNVAETLNIHTVAEATIFNRLTLISSAQTNAFILGLSLLGKGRLSDVKDGWATIPTIDYMGNVYDVKFKTMEHLQNGFILGITFLGYGYLMPKESIYVYPEGKKNPPFLDTITAKVHDVISRETLTTWAYSNYNKPEEMLNHHISEKTTQYDLLQSQRRQIENWVCTQIPPEESNAVRIRQYQNAVLQAICFKAKRHRWGFQGWESMTEEQFRDWWMRHWTGQGLNSQTLDKLYQGMKIWLSRLREDKLRLGESVKKARLRLALSA